VNQERFDNLTRALATTRLSRARMLKMLVATTLGTALGGSLLVENAEAKDKPKGHCKPKGARCRNDDQCCSGLCGDPVIILDNPVVYGKCCPECDSDQCLHCDTTYSHFTYIQCIDVCEDSDAVADCKCLKCDGQGNCIPKCNECQDCVGTGFFDCRCEDKHTCWPGESMNPKNNCECECPQGQTLCFDETNLRACVDTNSNPQHCGDCGWDCSFQAPRTACVNGQCVCPNQQSCSPPQVWNEQKCECECPITCPDGVPPDQNCKCPCPANREICGNTCCGECQHCDDPTTGTCRGCDPLKCEMCDIGSPAFPRPGRCVDQCGEASVCCGGECCGGVCEDGVCKPLDLVLSGGPDPSMPILLDDDYLEVVASLKGPAECAQCPGGRCAFTPEHGWDCLVFEGPTSPTACYGSSIPPISFRAYNGGQVQVRATNTAGDCQSLSPLYLHSSDGRKQVLDASGYQKTCGNPSTACTVGSAREFYYETFTIHVTKDLP
jgi:hypothetical protein